MIIERTLKFRGSKGQSDLLVLFDSGATFSCIRSDLVGGLAPTDPLVEPVPLETASEGTFIHVEQKALLEFFLNNLRLSDEFMVVPALSEQVVIGATTMQKWRIKLDFDNDEVITDPRASKLKLI
jgi:hypothetical protein